MLAVALGAGHAQSPAAPVVPLGGTATAAPVTTAAPQTTPSPAGSINGQSVARSAESNATAIRDARPALPDDLWKHSGIPVTAVRFEGVSFSAGDPIFAELKQRAGEPLSPPDVRTDERRLFQTGRYREISVRAETDGTGVALIYAGVPRFYVGRVEIRGVKQERLAGLLEFATKLDPGTAYMDAELPAAVADIKTSLANNGYFAASVIPSVETEPLGHQANFIFFVSTGPQARVGNVVVQGADSGFTPAVFRKDAGLNCGFLASHLQKNCRPKVNNDTVSNALSDIRGVYQKQNRLEGTVSLQAQQYAPERKQEDYTFEAHRGPLVSVEVDGAKISKSRLKLLVPIYEESAVDNDLLNEGSFNIHDYFQRKGYFDVQDSVTLEGAGTQHVTVRYTVDLGRSHRVMSVRLVGNKYFDDDTLEERLQVKKGDLYARSGSYSEGLVKADTASITALYVANGFNDVKVTSTVKDTDPANKKKPASIRVTYTIVEGAQRRFGTVQFVGLDAAAQDVLKGRLQSEPGQPFSLITLSADRDTVLNYLLSQGYEQAAVDVRQSADAGKLTTGIVFNVNEGHQVRIDHVLVSGDVHTRPALVDQQLEFAAGQPLNQSALLDSQRNLYNLALFNEANVAVQNPAGNALRKNVLVQLTEAKRWDVTYGFGFEAQTGTPAVVPGETRGSTAAQNGKAGVSPRVSIDVSRINVRGTQQSITLHATYGLLEQIALLSYNVPAIFNHPTLAVQVSGGYSNVQDISTFQSSTLQGDVRLTQKYKKADTFIYDFQYRRVSVNPNSLEISPNLIPQLSEPVVVGGPAFTWYHDTRDPTPLDAYRGQYISVQEFIADHAFGSDTNFNRLDLSQANYFTFGKKKYVLARNTRIGFENTFGDNSQSPTVAGTNTSCQRTGNTGNFDPATCNVIPLPERLYAGGASSHRGFGINDAGPRDLITGYPVGGSAVVVNTVELRLPPPTLPIVGDSVSFVIFHDMGNVFLHPGDMFTSIKNFHQPNQQTCSNVLPKNTPITVLSSTLGQCNFNYYSHAVGLGARYKTPVGPIRVDFSYNLNPPKYPVNYDYTSNSPYAGQAPHFNFFFSIGQAF